MTLTKEEILDNQRCGLCSFGISAKDEEMDLPKLYSEADLEGGVRGVRPPKIRKVYVIQR